MTTFGLRAGQSVRSLLFLLLMLQAGFGLVLGAGLVLVGVFAFASGVVLGLFTLFTAGLVILLAISCLRGWGWSRYAALLFETMLAAGGLLSLAIKPDLLALLTSFGLPLAIGWLLVYRWPGRVNEAETAAS